MNFPHLFVTVLFALNTGLRKGEIHQLRWRRIDLHNRLVHVEHNPIQGEATKDNKRRDIPINDTLHRALMIWKTHHSPKEDDLVFPIKTLDHSFHTALKKAGITDFRFHDLRHTFASHLVMSGVDLTTVSQLMGHSKITMTLKYAHLTPDHRKSAVLNLDGLMSVSRSISETENYDE